MKIRLTPKSVGVFYLSLVPIFGTIHWLSDPLWKTPLGFIESLYFSVVTITTSGYGDISPVTDAGRILTGTQAILGIVSIGLFLNSVSEKRAELQEKKRHDAVVKHLLWQYQNFRESVTEISLRAIAGSYNSDWRLKVHLPEMLKFREYFSENDNANWYVVLNALESDDAHRLKNLDVYWGDKVQYIGGFIYDVMAGRSVIDGYRDNDIYLEKFKKL